jgi:hypothetical protein
MHVLLYQISTVVDVVDILLCVLRACQQWSAKKHCR